MTNRHVAFDSMVIGMATKKITITLQDDQLKEVHALVSAGGASSVSGFVQNAVAVALHDAAGWSEMLGDALKQSGGALTREERAWADGILLAKQKRRGPRKGRAA